MTIDVRFRVFARLSTEWSPLHVRHAAESDDELYCRQWLLQIELDFAADRLAGIVRPFRTVRFDGEAAKLSHAL